jgi:hypothetical protein
MQPTRNLRFATAAALCATLLVSTAYAQEGQLAGAAPQKAASKSTPRFGLMMGAGVPDGASASMVYRPFSWLRAEAGGSYNMISKGVRGGVSVLPFGMGPSASLEAGHYFDGNANGIARSIAGGGFRDNAVLQRIGYDFVNAHLGLDFGFRRVVFFIHGGMSFVRANVHDLNAQIANGMSSGGTGGSSGTTVSINQDPIVRIFTPSAKLGLVFYIW